MTAALRHLPSLYVPKSPAGYSDGTDATGSDGAQKGVCPRGGQQTTRRAVN